MIDALIKIGFLEIRILDLLDILLVGILLYQLYRLLKGSIAFNIFIGLALVYIAWLITRALDMHLMEGILGQFIGVGVIALLIVFQPEVRRFLLYIGKTSMVGQGKWWQKILNKNWEDNGADISDIVDEVITAVENLSESKTGALIVFSGSTRLQYHAASGTILDARVSARLIESIFDRNSPLHDGAIIIADMRLYSAGCVLPVSENPWLPARVGLRHRAAVGITEQSDAFAIVVSEEAGKISYAREGKLHYGVELFELKQMLRKHLMGEREESRE